MADTINWKRNIFFVWLSQLLSLAGFGLCMPFIPIFMREVLKVEESMRGFYVSVFTFAGLFSLCIATAIWGMFADKFGRKLMLLRANYGAAILYPLLCFAPNVYVLIFIRFICSFFSGTVNPAQTLLVSTTPPEKHGFALGVLSTATWSGNMLGYVTGGILVSKFGYTATFLTCGALYMTGALIIQFLVKDNFNRAEVKKKEKVKLSLSQILSKPAVVAILSLFIFMGMSRRIGQPFVAMLVEIINGNDNAAFWTGIASAFAASGGVVAGFIFGWACDNIKLSKLLAPVIIVTVIASSVQAYATNLTVLMISQFVSYFAGGGLQPILLMWLSRITNPSLKGSYFGFSGSINVFGGILSSLLSGWIVLQFDVRSIFLTSGLLALIMLPIMFVAKKYSDGREDIAH